MLDQVHSDSTITLNWTRIRWLLYLGIVGSLLNVTGDLLLDWGVENEALTGFSRTLSAMISRPDLAIILSALLGLVGIALECVAYGSVYELTLEKKAILPRCYLVGVLGVLIFGDCGVHVPICASAYLAKHGMNSDLILNYARYFLLPACVLFGSFLLMLLVTQFLLLAKGLTPYPKWYCTFSNPVGMLLIMSLNLFGNHAWVNGITCGWMSLSSFILFTALLIGMKRVKDKVSSSRNRFCGCV